MKNINIYLPLVDGSRWPLEFETGKELIHALVGDDFGAPPNKMCIEGTTEDGMPIRISIPYSDSNEALVQSI